MVWSASEDGTLRQHDFREGASCPPGRSYPHECRNILVSFRRSVNYSPCLEFSFSAVLKFSLQYFGFFFCVKCCLFIVDCL